MVLHFTAEGVLCSIVIGTAHQGTPADAVAQLEADEATNEQLYQITQTAPESLRLVDGQLYWNGEPLALNGAGQAHVDRQMLLTIAGKVASGEALDADEIQCALRCLLRNTRLT